MQLSMYYVASVFTPKASDGQQKKVRIEDEKMTVG
jgi:hypothetical protein